MTIEARHPVPEQREKTIRQDLMRYLENQPGVTAHDISSALGITEKSVPGHLKHLQRSLRVQNQRLSVLPAACLDCGFVFRKRTRFSRPGRCPACRSTHLSEPRFGLG